MSFISILSRFFKRIKSHDGNYDLSSRWVHYSNGLILDSKNSGQPVWMVGSIWFEKWFHSLEDKLELSLGKRLIQASSEELEYYLLSNRIFAPKNNNIDDWKHLIMDFHQKGLGTFSFYGEDGTDVKILITDYSNINIAIGYLSSAWEYMSGKRYKSSWADSESSILLTLSPSSDTFPPPVASINLSQHRGEKSVSNSSEWWEMLSLGSEGCWYIQNSRKLIISSDMFEKFITSSIPFIQLNRNSRYDNYKWNDIDASNSTWWSASAESSRELFILQSFHIMIREIKDWKKVGYNHLQKTGLGAIIDVENYDDGDGIIFTLHSLFHPSITCGILLACWERANGRNGKLEFTKNENHFSLKIFSGQSISEDIS